MRRHLDGTEKTHAYLRYNRHNDNHIIQTRLNSPKVGAIPITLEAIPEPKAAFTSSAVSPMVVLRQILRVIVDLNVLGAVDLGSCSSTRSTTSK